MNRDLHGSARIRSAWLLSVIVTCFTVSAGVFSPAKPGYVSSSDNALQSQPGILSSEFVFDRAPFEQCHASTIVETRDGLCAAWFGGTREGIADVGIWVSRLTSGKWSVPVEAATGVRDLGPRYPCWNPVLFQPREGPLMLFYKVGPSPDKWWGMMKTSDDQGKKWRTAIALPRGFLGPIKNKPIELSDGSILCPSSTEDGGWRVHFEKFWYKTGKWEMIGPVNDGKEFEAIQPSLLIYRRDGNPGDRLQALCRSRQGVITETWSQDGGETWNPMKATALPNPNAGIDAVTLRNGMQLLVYNHTTGATTPRLRESLNVAVSEDGLNWRAALTLENARGSEFSYPAVIQTSDGLVHVTYTWLRCKIKHVVIDPAKLETRPIIGGRWPS